MPRIEHDVVRPAEIAIEFDGERLPAYPGETVAAALLAAGKRTFRRTADGAPRGPYCNMGVCFECVVVVDDVRVRACMTAVRDGMVVRTSQGRAGS
jgi:predicted molibdopterin-dependent oxidoreductase YjgC